MHGMPMVKKTDSRVRLLARQRRAKYLQRLREGGGYEAFLERQRVQQAERRKRLELGGNLKRPAAGALPPKKVAKKKVMRRVDVDVAAPAAPPATSGKKPRGRPPKA